MRHSTNKYRFFIFFIFFLSVGWRTCSQSLDHEWWINYALSIPVSRNLSYGGDAGIRGSFTSPEWNRFLIRPTISYRFTPVVGIGGGLSFFGTYQRESGEIYEFRIHQEANVNWPDLTVLSIFHRLRIEQRFIFFENLPNDFDLRVRYLIGAESMDFTFLGSKRPVYFQTLWEVFTTLRKEGMEEIYINQGRLHFAFGHRVSNRFRYELHYIRQSSRIFSDEELQFSQNIYRVRLFHRLAGKTD